METNTIYDVDKNRIGLFRTGVCWSKPEQVRLGFYEYNEHQGFVQNLQNENVSSYKNGEVFDLESNKIGSYTDKLLYKNNKLVGSYIGNSGSAAAAITFLFKSDI